MGWIFQSDEAKTKDDYVQLLNEIIAYRELDGEDFDFGTGLIKNDMSLGSEDAYYEMDMCTLENIIINWDFNQEAKHRKKHEQKPHKRHYQKREKDRVSRLSKISWIKVIEREGWQQRCYRGKRSRYLKRQSNKKIRRYKGKLPPKGSTHYKIFDFWWEMY